MGHSRQDDASRGIAASARLSHSGENVCGTRHFFAGRHTGGRYISAMYFRQFYDQPLAQASYMIGCQITGEAIVIDALRDVSSYLNVAASEGLRITQITETHIHADFVSGARELAAATGARVYLSAEGGVDWQYGFAQADGATLLHDGDVIMVGNIRLDVMHTPGHTPEHLAFVVTDTPRAAGPMGVITGDFVFVGDVGRPDLLEKAAGIANTMEDGARTLFRSLQRFRQLPDHLQVWPGHGAGSACGKALGAVPSSTVGYERRANWGVAETDEDHFVQAVLDGQPEPPRYFAQMKRINREGPRVLGAVPVPPRLDPSRVSVLQSEAWLVDLRPAAVFADGHLPGVLSIPYGKSFSTWTGSLVPYDVDIVLLGVTPASAHDEHRGPPAEVAAAARDLMLIGLDRVIGWMDADAAAAAWMASGATLQTVSQLTVPQLAARQRSVATPGDFTVLDVRGESEWRAGHLPEALHIPLGDLTDRASSLPDGPIVVQCQSGARSAIGASLLQRLGRQDVYNLVGGYAAWRLDRVAQRDALRDNAAPPAAHSPS